MSVEKRMSSKDVKKASMEIVDGLKCVLEAQFGERSKESCVPVLKMPVYRFCKIARDTAGQIYLKSMEAREKRKYNVSQFLGDSATSKKKMGTICSSVSNFPQCDLALKMRPWKMKHLTKSDHQKAIDNWMAQEKICTIESGMAIKNKPIEASQDYNKLLTSYETMRDWMHGTGYNLPDYVWVTPRAMRTKVKKMFEFLASREVRSVEDLNIKRREIQRW